jgi:hypothetical protein
MNYPAFIAETPSSRIDDPLARLSASYGRRGDAARYRTMVTIRPGGSA